MSVIESFAEILKHVSWPIAAVIIACFFKSEVKNLLPRLRRAGPSGVEFEVSAQIKQNTGDGCSLTSTDPKPIPGINKSKMIEEVERSIYQTLSSLPDDQKTARLVHALAVTRLSAFFDNTYNVIFGSQIHGLKLLNSVDSALIDDAKAFFQQEAREKFKPFYDDYGFDGWFGFLERQGLVARTGERIHITELGKEFLLYMTVKGMSEFKKF